MGFSSRKPNGKNAIAKPGGFCVDSLLVSRKQSATPTTSPVEVQPQAFGAPALIFRTRLATGSPALPDEKSCNRDAQSDRISMRFGEFVHLTMRQPGTKQPSLADPERIDISDPMARQFVASVVSEAVDRQKEAGMVGSQRDRSLAQPFQRDRSNVSDRSDHITTPARSETEKCLLT